MKVCVVGATGFVGTAVSLALDEAGHEVTATARTSHGGGGNLDVLSEHHRIKVVRADLDDEDSILDAVTGAEVVVNCLGLYRWWAPKKDYQHVNVDGALIVGRSCLGCASVRRLIHISTAMSYGYPADSPFSESSAAGPHASEYAASKHRGDVALHRLFTAPSNTDSSSPTSLITLFLGCVVGPGDTISVGRPGAVCDDFMNGRIPMLVAPDTQYVYVHIRDVCKAVIKACGPGEIGKGGVPDRFLIGNHRQVITTRGLFELMSKHGGRASPRLTLPIWLAYAIAAITTTIAVFVTKRPPLLPIDIIKTSIKGSILYDCSKSEQRLGITYTDIDDAIGDAIRDIRSRNSTKKHV